MNMPMDQVYVQYQYLHESYIIKCHIINLYGVIFTYIIIRQNNYMQMYIF